MAIAYQTFADTPCAIIRAATGTQPDGEFRSLRVGMPGATPPAGQVGTVGNKVFFEKLKAAAMRLTGAATESGLSNALLSNVFWLSAAPNAHFQAELESLFPNGQLLDFPFIEQAGAVSSGSEPPFLPQFGAVQFEDTGGASPPTYADFLFTVYPNGADPADIDSNIIIVKLFHSLTT